MSGSSTYISPLLIGPVKPENKLDASIQGQLGNYRDREVEDYINIPIVDDKMLLRVSAKYVSRDGYTKDIGSQEFGFASVLTSTRWLS